MRILSVTAAAAISLTLAACGSAEQDTATTTKSDSVAQLDNELDDEQMTMADVDYAMNSQIALAKAGYTEDLDDGEGMPETDSPTPEQFAAYISGKPALKAVFAKADVDPARFYRSTTMVAQAALAGEMAFEAKQTDGLAQPAQFYLEHRDEIKKRFESLEQLN